MTGQSVSPVRRSVLRCVTTVVAVVSASEKWTITVRGKTVAAVPSQSFDFPAGFSQVIGWSAG